MEDTLLFDNQESDFHVQTDNLGGLAQEEHKEEVNYSTSSDASEEDEPMNDMMDFPSTQVLPEDRNIPHEEEKEQEDVQIPMETPKSPMTLQSPVKPRSSPVKTRASPVKARSSPLKIRSPAKMQSSPAKARSPAKVRLSLIKARSPAKPKAAKPLDMSSPTKKKVAEVEEEKKEEDEVSGEFKEEGPAGKFTKVFPQISKLVETGGWQIAQGLNTLFCAMPGVQFFNFKPNINVFDSKVKACWKFIQIAGEKKVDTEDTELWDMLWPIAEKEFGWFTMMCGPETWYVKPNTKFEQFRPNETIFQTKKRAVLKCLATEVGDIALGDSAEGRQVISFAPRQTKPPAVKKAKIALFKTPSPAVKSVKRTTPPSAATRPKVTPPSNHRASTPSNSAISGAKRKLSSSASKVESKKKVKNAKTNAKKTTAKKTRGGAPETSPANEFNFTPPEFKCTFGIVYGKLQDEGWHHRSGMFEYDYFSPTYSDATKELNVNFFRSQADLEEYLKVSGTWKRIEGEMRAEFEVVVEEERELALERHFKQLASKRRAQATAAMKKREGLVASKPKKTAAKKTASKKTSSTPKLKSLMPKMKFGTVVKKLIDRGWYYRPGRFEYDYFKPSANPKTAVSGEDRFESSQALEVYLKTTGLWEEIAEEVAHDELSKHDAAAHRHHEDTNGSPEPAAKRSKLASPPPAKARSPKFSKPSNGVHKDEVKSITNDIWANSHEFDFDE
ncbi:hypothetical protein BBO99_00007804 [Phytophthora kernoviae]|uniref:Uncharacterized protein n=1 Tax=Phytophthora kernoviae TaxID=325452 RepID=A0A3R7GUZ6_9STRA|nr:hypothetical protein JM16_004054 [Phytophthora kernoviae]RLN32305.1 hypothetical protein BBI17_005726 [Phytophthora kernoviae]RLN76111.1 hypothetical protein BBO99_00007804 [Phytophthora kernoviae]